MKAIRVAKVGGPEVLEYVDVPRPEPESGELLVEIEAAGVNFVDTYHRTGSYKGDLPFTLGVEGAGRVVEVGPDVVGYGEGDRVAYAMTRGSYAEYAVVPADVAVKVPERVETRVAAAVILQGMTAHYLSHSSYALQEGDTALLHAAAGGVGSLLVQMAARLGARVIGTASTQEKIDRARRLGAHEMINYTQTDFQQQVQGLTDGRGVHVVYDGVGQATFIKGLDCLRPRGTMVLYGQASGAVEPLDPQVLNNKGSLFLTRPTLGDYVATREELRWRAGDLFRWIEAGELEVRIDRTFPLQDAADAHRYIEARNTRGKLLLIP